MTCTRCGSHMLHGHHDEVEHVADEVVLVTQVFIHECLSCGVMFKVIVPLIPSQTTEA